MLQVRLKRLLASSSGHYSNPLSTGFPLCPGNGLGGMATMADDGRLSHVARPYDDAAAAAAAATLSHVNMATAAAAAAAPASYGVYGKAGEIVSSTYGRQFAGPQWGSDWSAPPRVGGATYPPSSSSVDAGLDAVSSQHGGGGGGGSGSGGVMSPPLPNGGPVKQEASTSPDDAATLLPANPGAPPRRPPATVGSLLRDRQRHVASPLDLSRSMEPDTTVHKVVTPMKRDVYDFSDGDDDPQPVDAKRKAKWLPSTADQRLISHQGEPASVTAAARERPADRASFSPAVPTTPPTAAGPPIATTPTAVPPVVATPPAVSEIRTSPFSMPTFAPDVAVVTTGAGVFPSVTTPPGGVVPTTALPTYAPSFPPFVHNSYASSAVASTVLTQCMPYAAAVASLVTTPSVSTGGPIIAMADMSAATAVSPASTTAVAASLSSSLPLDHGATSVPHRVPDMCSVIGDDGRPIAVTQTTRDEIAAAMTAEESQLVSRLKMNRLEEVPRCDCSGVGT